MAQLSITGTAPENVISKLPLPKIADDVTISPVANFPEDNYVLRNRRTPLRFFSSEEVKKHNTAEDCWVIVDGKVYNVTAWVKRHPGGELLILLVAGMDVTDPFLVNHLPSVREKILPKFQVGFVEDYKVCDRSVAFREMSKMVEQNGWYETDYSYYVKMLAWYSFLFLSSLHCIIYGTSFLVRTILGSFLMALFWQQVAFAGHDLGHMAVTHNRVVDNLIAVVGGNFVMGIAIGWWKATHNVHHLVTNYLEYDPDIQHLPVLAVSNKFYDGIWSLYHERRIDFDPIAQFFIKRQHLLFYPIMFVARFNLYIQSILLLIHPKEAIRRGVFYPRLELLMLCLFHVWHIQLLRLLPSWIEVAIFVVLSHGVAGVLHLQICLSHFPMEIMDKDADAKPLERVDFLKQQLATCLDVDCHPWIDWFHGGLQFQTIHHLFPLLPRHRLRDLMYLVEELCAKEGLVYNKVNFWKANSMILGCLKKTADGVHPWLHSLLMAEG